MRAGYSPQFQLRQGLAIRIDRLAIIHSQVIETKVHRWLSGSADALPPGARACLPVLLDHHAYSVVRSRLMTCREIINMMDEEFGKIITNSAYGDIDSKNPSNTE